ncbi:unnamed protein product [Ectocarpus fasciculatus]
MGERSLKRKAIAAALAGDDEVEVVRAKKIKVTVTVAGGRGGFGEPSYSETKQVEVRNRMKLLQFHQDHRPAYWGTWSKNSTQVTGRRPLGRDTKGTLNYDYDSEEDWEEEAQGEDLLSDEEVEPEDNLDYKARNAAVVNDGWLRQDDEFSDEEIDRFDSGKSNNNANNNTTNTTTGPNNRKALGFVGEGVTIGAGAAAAAGGGGGGGGSASNGQQQQQQQQQHQPAFVSAIMFRRRPISDEEARERPALRALSGYRAVTPFSGGTGRRPQTPAFPVGVVGAMVEKARRNDTGEGGGAGAGAGVGKEEGKVRKVKDVPDELLPLLVEKLHGKADKREDVVNAFVAEHPQCTKKSVHQKVKDMATRERSLHGGTVFVVNPEVIERLGVETRAVELKPSQAEAAAAAAALKAEKAAESAAAAAAAAAAGDDDGVNTTPGGGPKTTGDKSKIAPLPGQLSLLGFLQTAKVKGATAGDSSPPSRATPKMLFGPNAKDEGDAPSSAGAGAGAVSSGTETCAGKAAAAEEGGVRRRETMPPARGGGAAEGIARKRRRRRKSRVTPCGPNLAPMRTVGGRSARSRNPPWAGR